MRTILTLTMKDLRRRLAAPVGVIINLAIPLALAAMMALAFGGIGGEDSATPVLRVLVLDLDKTPLSGLISGPSQNADVAKHLSMKPVASRDEGLSLLRDGEASALLVIPEGFASALLEGNAVELELIKNPAESIMPIVAEQGAQVAALYLSVGARLLGDEAPRMRRLLVDGEGWGDAAGLATMIAKLYARVEASADLLIPPIVEVETSGKDADAQGGFNFLGWMYPGMLMMGLLFVGGMQMRDLLRERAAGTLKRVLSAPVGASQVLASKLIGGAVLVALSMGLLILTGRLLFGISWGRFGPLAATSVLVVLAVTGFMAFLYSLVRTERQGDAIGGIVIMVMSLAGGAFIPPQAMPVWMRGLALGTVNHWGHEALRALTAGGGWREVGPYLAALAAIGAIGTAAGSALLRWRHLRGAL